MQSRLIPELDVSDLQQSLRFYVGMVGFELKYERPEERFAMLELDGAALMLEEAAGPGRRFRTAPLEKPFGRGVNFQVQVGDAGTLYKNLLAAKAQILIPLEERWYRSNDQELGNCQFVVADPDGYLMRFFTDLGVRVRG
jgi:catechol 2,3-dioxygenase-like lactoylglutathione lyase family enzyme